MYVQYYFPPAQPQEIKCECKQNKCDDTMQTQIFEHYLSQQLTAFKHEYSAESFLFGNMLNQKMVLPSEPSKSNQTPIVVEKKPPQKKAKEVKEPKEVKEEVQDINDLIKNEPEKEIKSEPVIHIEEQKTENEQKKTEKKPQNKKPEMKLNENSKFEQKIEQNKKKDEYKKAQPKVRAESNSTSNKKDTHISIEVM
ncbi:Hypothetical_protein [Hexamita inflata]|uniref:Hypothetical_protein n=1 Tax=Hexamita inflata TaxID=28002 RepID=A0AA86NPU0_9EUKA|nr:Hypothetical protein HINF_LOCUS10999 [Hexamita inflata]